MKKIAYVVPYFGKLPDFIEVWLKTCEKNLDIEWLLFTDDHRDFSYPQNVKVTYMTFESLRNRIQKFYDFKISLEKPYKLCDYRPAYGEIFKPEIRGYDFWGYCDIDVVFGNIRSFITDEILSDYDVIGFLGHSTLFRNTDRINGLYRIPLQDKELYREIFLDPNNCYFDEVGLQKLLKQENISVYDRIIFADISPLYWHFRIGRQDSVGIEKNKHRIFTWENGELLSQSIYEGQICSDAYMYVHFLRREMIIEKELEENWLIIPNKIVSLDRPVGISDILKYSHNNMLKYWLDFVRRKWKKVTISKIVDYLRNRLKADRTGL